MQKASLSFVCKCCTADTLAAAMANNDKLDANNGTLLEEVGKFCS